MMLTLELLKNMPFSSIDRHFATYILEQSELDDPMVYAAAAIASAAVRMGHSCCDLNEFSGKTFSDFFLQLSQNEEYEKEELNIPFPSVETFRKVLGSLWGIVSTKDWNDQAKNAPWFQTLYLGVSLTEAMDDHVEEIPLILDTHGRLYLNRYFMYEKELAERLLEFVHTPESDFAPGKEKFNGVIPYFQLDPAKPVEHVDWQKFAAYLTGFSPLTIITGGPGTGKTTVVAAVLALLLEKYESTGKFPKIKLCAPTYPYLSDYKRVWEMDLDKGAYEGLRYYFRHCDPRHQREDEIFEKLGYIDIQFLASRIRAKVLMGTGLMDTTCPPSTQFAMFNKITSEKEVVIYPDYGHENLKGHDDIVFDFLEEL